MAKSYSAASNAIHNKAENTQKEAAKGNIEESVQQKQTAMPGEAGTDTDKEKEQKKEASSKDPGNNVNLKNDDVENNMENAAEPGANLEQSGEAANGIGTDAAGADAENSFPESGQMEPELEIPISNDMMDSLNGVDPLNKNANLEDMNKALANPDELTKRDHQNNGTVEFDGQMFHQTWKESLGASGKNTLDSAKMEHKGRKTSSKDMFES